MRFNILLLAVLFMIILGCTGSNVEEIKNQEDIITSNMQNAAKLLEFEEIGQLSSFKPEYSSYSNNIGYACDKLSSLDKNKKVISKKTEAVCENKKSLDDCFFYIEKIKTKLGNNQADINLDNLDILCRDLRSVNLDMKLEENFKQKYKNYTAWLNAESYIKTEWDSLKFHIQNYSSEQLAGAKVSDYYKSFKGVIDNAKISLNGIKEKCLAKNNFKETDLEAGQVCDDIDTYLSDADKFSKALYTVFSFYNKFEVGTTVVNDAFISECNEAYTSFKDVSELKFVKDTSIEKNNISAQDFYCDSLENLSIVYSNLGIPLVFEDGKLSSNTKIGVLKAKTVYITTNTALGSGVILGSDTGGYYILTNAHVVIDYDEQTGTHNNPTSVRVKFYDNHISYASGFYFSKEYYDFALLYVPVSVQKYPTATYDEVYYPNVGTPVVAIGNPYGFEFSVTQGTVSGVRDGGCLSDYCYGAVIQTDTAINPGNSGGGLWDFNTLDLVGINSLAFTQAQGINFAISMVQYGKLKDTFQYFDIG